MGHTKKAQRVCWIGLTQSMFLLQPLAPQLYPQCRVKTTSLCTFDTHRRTPLTLRDPFSATGLLRTPSSLPLVWSVASVCYCCLLLLTCFTCIKYLGHIVATMVVKIYVQCSCLQKKKRDFLLTGGRAIQRAKCLVFIGDLVACLLLIVEIVIDNNLLNPDICQKQIKSR